MVVTVRDMTTAQAPPEAKIALTMEGLQTQIKDLKAAAANSSKVGASADTFEPNSALEKTEGLTSFIDSVATIAEVPTSHGNTPHSKLRIKDADVMSIDRFLERPIFMTNLTWSSTQTAGTGLATFNLPNDLFALSPIKVEKINRYQFINSDIVVRMFGSPMQFQAGRLWMYFENYRNEKGARQIALYPPMFTSLPGVEYDPGRPAPVELRIPFKSIVSQWDTIGQYGLGTLQVVVLSQLNSASTSNSMTLSLTAHFENLSLAMPRQDNVSLYPNSLGRQDRSIKQEFLFTAESGRAEMKQAKENHIISDTLDKTSEIAGALGSFPLLSAVAQPVAWATKAAAMTARMFGFDKPLDNSMPTKIMNHNQLGFVNADGPLPAVSLTNSTNFAVDQKDSYMGAAIDELDIGYIAGRLVQISNWTWNTTDTVGKIISVIPVMPGVAVQAPGTSIGTVTYKTYAPGPMAFVSSLFKYWAGSIKYRLEAVSTPFHAGRLLVAYIPDYNPNGTYSLTEMGNNYSIVWDIMDQSHIEFEVPYCSNSPYLHNIMDTPTLTWLISGDTTTLAPRNRIRKCANGVIVIAVLNQLVSPSVASSSIDILNWSGGGKDLTFAEPVLGCYRPSNNAATRIDYGTKFYDGSNMTTVATGVQPARRKREEEGQDFKAEYAGAVLNPISDQDPLAVGSVADKSDFGNWLPPVYLDPIERAKLCTGEAITNLRQLITRPTPAYTMFPQNYSSSLGVSTTTWPNSNHVLTFDPDYFGTHDGVDDGCIYPRAIAAADSGAGGTKWLQEQDTYLSYISTLFAFVRGSRIYGIQSNPSNVINSGRFANPDVTDATAPSASKDIGTFEFRISTQTEIDSPPRQPYFRPEEGFVGYNYANSSLSTLAGFNYKYGYNNVLSGNMAVRKTGEPGCGLAVKVHSSSNYPFRLLSTTTGTEANYIIANTYNAPRSRRFVELRYRPFSAASFGTQATAFKPNLWPIPLTIMESAADDFNFGCFQAAPLLVKINQALCFPDYIAGTKSLY